eukprot:4830343-Amphidinium_carterae.1
MSTRLLSKEAFESPLQEVNLQQGLLSVNLENIRGERHVHTSTHTRKKRCWQGLDRLQSRSKSLELNETLNTTLGL